jgi:hypothetical protein
MRALDSAEVAAVQQRAVMAREFLIVTARDRGTGALTEHGFWNDIRPVTAPIKDGRTGATRNVDFTGVAGALDIGAIPLTADITVRNVEVSLPAIDAVVATLVRGTDVRAAPMQILRGYFDPATHILLAPAKARFVGYVDGAPIVTPAEGGEGSVTLKCVSATRELTRVSTEVRSHQSQLARTNGADDFYIDAAVVGDWDIAWGENRGPTTNPKPGK